MRTTLKKYRIAFLSAAAVLAATAGYGLSHFKNEISAYQTISGLKSGDNIKIELLADNQIRTIKDETIGADNTDYKTDAFSKTQNHDRYNLIYTLTSQDYLDTADISFAVNRLDGTIEASAQGLDSESVASLRVDDTIIHDHVKTDWSGKASLKAETAALQDQNITKICLDIGGYRGGSLTVCHEDVNPKAVQVQFGGLLGGLFGGGGGIQQTLVEPLIRMTEQFSTVMIQQVSVIGTFLDAKHQLETQRVLQKLQARAHKDYHPSEQMCTIGTLVRNLAETESNVKLAKVALNENIRTRELISGSPINFDGTRSDKETRRRALQNYHCESYDFGGQLQDLCVQAVAPKDQNADIDFTRTIDLPLTLNVDFKDNLPTDDERNVFYMLHSLFNADTIPKILPGNIVDNPDKTAIVNLYQDLRSLSAMRSIARNSMSNIVAQKVAGPNGTHQITPYMEGLMQDFGLDAAEITLMIGENPSYFAQMELLTKKIYQHPNFFSNLYDKPENVKRLRAAMAAIKMMQDRDIYDALVRREMLMSMLLESDLRDEQSRLQAQIKRKKVWQN